MANCCLAIALGCLPVWLDPGSPQTPADRSGQATGYRDNWGKMKVPGTWDDHTDGSLAGYDGFAWYRCYVQVPEGFSKIELWVEHVDNVHEAYFNGTKLGSAGSFPPAYENGLDQTRRYAIPARAVQPGMYHCVALRVYDHSGQGGFKGRAPMLVSGNSAIGLEGTWQFRLGDDPSWSQVAAVPTPAGFAFSKAVALSSLAGDPARPLPPDEALKSFTVPDDLELEVVLAEPVIRQPIFMDFDERGRLWVVNYLQYPYPAGLKPLSRDEYWRTVYDKVPPAPPHQFPGRDMITIHEDSDGDGIFDKHKTFLEGLSIVTSCARGRGGVWVLNPPYLLFYPDVDGDDIPDGDPKVHLSGFGLEDTHSVVNSLRWGPDGWLYAAQGSTVSGHVIRPGFDEPAVHSMGQNIWRYHPETGRYEVFAEGGGNAFGVEIDALGRTFSGHNGGNTRGFHYVQGGYYQKGFGKHGPLSNPYAFGYFQAMKHPDVPRFTHTFVVYQGAGLPGQYDGKLFGVAPLLSYVVYSEMLPDGTSLRTRDLGFAVRSSDVRFRPVDIKVGPDGAIYVADMYEPQISHRQHYEGQIERENGRIYRLKAKGSKPHTCTDLSQKSSLDLVQLLGHPNKWYRQTALRLLGDRKDRSVVPALEAIIASHTDQLALDTLWALNLSGGLSEAYAATLLQHGNPNVRLWTVRLMCDDHVISRAFAERLADLAAGEPDAVVRSQLACSARRLPTEYALTVTRSLLQHDEDNGDVHIPLLLWWSIEAQVSRDPERVVALFQDSPFWRLEMVHDHIIERLVRRLAVTGTRSNLMLCARLFQLAPDQPALDRLKAGFEQAYEGRVLGSLPEELLVAMSRTGGLTLSLGLRQGRPEAVAEALSQIADSDGDSDQRVELIRILGEVKVPECVPVLLRMIRSEQSGALQTAALSALQQYSDPRIGQEIIDQLRLLEPGAAEVAQTLLASRKTWARQALEAVDQGRLAKNLLGLETLRRMTVYQDEQMARLMHKHWGEIQGATSEEMRQLISRLLPVLRSDAGNPYEGKRIFQDTCAKCHVLFDEGGRIGPDLTPFKRDDIENLLVNVVNPSAEIREGFETHLIVTKDGRTVSGFLVDRDKDIVVLRGSDGQNVTLRQEDIEEQVAQPKSIMPEDLLKPFSDEQVRDLFVYLRSSQPLNN